MKEKPVRSNIETKRYIFGIFDHIIETSNSISFNSIYTIPTCCINFG